MVITPNRSSGSGPTISPGGQSRRLWLTQKENTQLQALSGEATWKWRGLKARAHEPAGGVLPRRERRNHGVQFGTIAWGKTTSRSDSKHPRSTVEGKLPGGEKEQTVRPRSGKSMASAGTEGRPSGKEEHGNVV
ncbi:hypothetical protein NDU88_004390 [Pleurodeles waltl]|uniref:Uncharacterized protein n=1 Tax=Pleurodeles waltl TaxID=8319 RepID=A0AAV7VK80_PLEWA|nr:hypothetical protein NDU88_004390 [Pleurodeles waltl]